MEDSFCFALPAAIHMQIYYILPLAYVPWERHRSRRWLMGRDSTWCGLNKAGFTYDTFLWEKPSLGATPDPTRRVREI